MKILHPFYILLLLMVASPSWSQQKLNVVASASIFRDMVEQIGKDKIVADQIVPVGGDPHLYEPIPTDPEKVRKADLLLINGMTFEGWILELIENSGTKAKSVLITKGVTAIESDRYENASDPHAWMDVQNGLVYIRNIKNALVAADPANKEYYEKNYFEYRQKLVELDDYVSAEISKIPKEIRVLITSHDAFAYYGKRYGIELQALKGISTDAEIQTSDMLRVSKKIKESGVPAIFVESTINPKVIEQIAKDNGIQIGGELFADSIGDKDSEAPTYYDMIKHNTDVIVNALSRRENSKTDVDELQSGSPLIFYGVLGLFLILATVFFIKKMS